MIKKSLQQCNITKANFGSDKIAGECAEQQGIPSGRRIQLYPVDPYVRSKHALGAPLPAIASRPYWGTVTEFDDLMIATYPPTAPTQVPAAGESTNKNARTAETLYIPNNMPPPTLHTKTSPQTH